MYIYDIYFNMSIYILKQKQQWISVGGPEVQFDSPCWTHWCYMPLQCFESRPLTSSKNWHRPTRRRAFPIFRGGLKAGRSYSYVTSAADIFFLERGCCIMWKQEHTYQLLLK